MNEEQKTKLIDHIIARMSTQKFADWYSGGGNFDKWICGDLPRVSNDTIREDVEKMFLQNI